jgi:thymidylate synthase
MNTEQVTNMNIDQAPKAPKAPKAPRAPRAPRAPKVEAPEVINQWDAVYSKLANEVITKGMPKTVRGHDTRSLLHQHFTLDLAQGFPLLTTRKVNFKHVVREVLWYISGSSNVNDLGPTKVFWQPWADIDGNLPSAYGKFLTRFPRYFEADRDAGESVVPYSDGPINQIGHIIQTLVSDPMSRRMVATFWHPANTLYSSQPPCHVSLVFNTTYTSADETSMALNLLVTQRSADIALGLVIDVANYALLTELIAKYVGMGAGQLTFSIADAHVYEDHAEALAEQIKLQPFEAPHLKFERIAPCDYVPDDIDLVGYQSHPTVRYQLSV